MHRQHSPQPPPARRDRDGPLRKGVSERTVEVRLRACAPECVTAHARAVVAAASPALDRIREFWASANFTDAMLRVPWLTMTSVPANMQSIQWDRLSNNDLLGSITGV